MPNAYGTTTALGGNANSATNGTYTSLGVIAFGATPPNLCFLEVSLQATGTTGNQQCLIYARTRLDGTNFSDAPSSATLTNAVRVGSIQLANSSAHRTRAIELSQFFGGGLPPEIEIYIFNDTGAALASTGQVGQYRTETFS